MKYILTLLTGFVLLSCGNKKDKQVNSRPVSTITEVGAIAALNAWKEGYLENNVETVDTLVHSSWVYSGSSNGKTTSKHDMLEELKTAGYYYSEIIYSDLQTRIYDDVAIITGKEKLVIIDKETTDSVTIHLRFTDVYKSIDGKVKAISTHSSPFDE